MFVFVFLVEYVFFLFWWMDFCIDFGVLFLVLFYRLFLRGWDVLCYFAWNLGWGSCFLVCIFLFVSWVDG